MADEDGKKSINIDYYIEMLLKRRWFIIIPFCISMIIGITLSIKLPRRYMAITSILVEPQRVPSKYVQSLMDSDIEERVVTLQEQVLSQTNLEGIIDKFNLFTGPQYAKMYLEDKVGSLRKQITVKVTKAARRGADAFSISFEGREPEMVMNVVNTLASSFIDKNLELREQRAIGTVEFLDGQQADMRKKLTDVEERVKEFRKAHMGELPEQLSSNEKVLDRLQQKTAERQLALREAQNRMADFEKETRNKLSLLEEQINVMEQQTALNIPSMPILDNDTEIPAPSGASSGDSDRNSILKKLRDQYEGARLKYTARHPDVLKMKKMMDDLEADIAKEEEKKKAEAKELAKNKPAEDPVEADKIQVANETAASSKSAFGDEVKNTKKGLLQDTEEKRLKKSAEIASIEEEIAKLEKDAKEYEHRVNVTPKRDQEMMSLMRDYSSIQKYYSELSNRKLEADIALDMERRAKGEQFRILDKAKKPEKPVSPDVMKLLIIFSLAGLGIGIGIAFLLDFMDNTLKRAEDVEPLLDIPVLATIPKAYDRKDMMKRKINQLLSIGSAMVAGVLFTVFALLAVKGVEPMLDIVRKVIGKKI